MNPGSPVLAAALPMTWMTTITVHGPDRVRFLHNVCTADIYKLITGRDGASFGKRPKEAFTMPSDTRACFASALNRQGKMVAVFTVWTAPDVLMLNIDREAARSLLTHLQSLIVADKVTVMEVTQGFSFYYLTVPHAGPALRRPPMRLGVETMFDPGRSYVPLHPADYHAACVEAGWPQWGADMDESMLPMEAGLDPIAISYEKGCYLGQEVVQRVKTYSEPPRELKQLHFDGPAPSPRTPVIAGGASVGETRSASGSIALALMKKSHAKDGSRVDGAVVRDLPWHHWK